MNQTIRIGIVGAGANTVARHIPNLRKQEGVEIVSVCNRSRASSERVARQFGIPNVYNHWEALVKAADTNAIVIGTWPYLHCRATLAALAAGKHVLCEARMAMDLDEGRQMLEAADAHSAQVAQLVPSPFTLHVDRTIRHLENQGLLGRILAIEIRSLSGHFVDRDAPLSWRQSGQYSGVNLLTLGIWYETLMRWAGEAVDVTCLGKTVVKQRQDPVTHRMVDVRLPDHVTVVATMASGAQATFLLSSIAGLTPENAVTLYGDNGTLRFSDGVLYAGVKGDRQLTQMPIPPEDAIGWRVEEEFVSAIRGRESVSRTTFADGVKYMAFTEAAWRSFQSGRTVPVPPD